MTYDEELKSRFIDAFGGAPQLGPDIHASDPDSLVDLTWSAGSDLTVRVSRSLVPSPTERDQLERVLRQAITSLVTQREQSSTAAAAALAETLTKMTGSDFERQAADVTARVSEFKSQIEARQQAIRERRNRLGL